MKFVVLFFFLMGLSNASQVPYKVHECKKDVKTFCKNVPLYKKVELHNCLTKNLNRISKLCRERVVKTTKTLKEKNKCYEDIQKLCPGDTKIKEMNTCLKKNEKKLSKLCLQQREEMRKKRKPCESDIKAFCATVKKGKGRLNKCLSKNEKKLSVACREAREKHLKKIVKKKPCYADVTKYCADVKPGKGAIHRCLEKNSSKLSDSCTKERKKVMAQRTALNPCYPDIISLCSEFTGDDKKVRKCLEKKMDNVSSTCRDRMSDIKKRRSSIQIACKEDEKKYCKNIPKKGNKMLKCLAQNISKLSTKCVDELKNK